MLVNAAGSSLIFPFFTLYVRQRFDVPMTTIGLAMAVMAGVGLISGALGGALADRFGRKTLMVGGLALAGISSFTMGVVDSLAAFVAVAIFINLIFPLSRPASEAMIADLVEPKKRARAYGLMRVSFNLGVAIGPAVWVASWPRDLTSLSSSGTRSLASSSPGSSSSSSPRPSLTWPGKIVSPRGQAMGHCCATRHS